MQRRWGVDRRGGVWAVPGETCTAAGAIRGTAVPPEARGPGASEAVPVGVAGGGGLSRPW